MTITVNNLIRAGALAQNIFKMKDNFKIRIFPSDCPRRVLVYEDLEPERVGPYPPSPYGRLPQDDEVELHLFAGRENMDEIRIGYSERLNILCLSLI